jgi:hypothetical protein
MWQHTHCTICFVCDVATRSPLIHSHRKHHLPDGLIVAFVQLPPHQAQGQGQATTRRQDGSFHHLQCSFRIPLPCCSSPKQLAGSRFIQYIHPVMMQLLVQLHMSSKVVGYVCAGQRDSVHRCRLTQAVSLCLG